MRERVNEGLALLSEGRQRVGLVTVGDETSDAWLLTYEDLLDDAAGDGQGTTLPRQ